MVETTMVIVLFIFVLVASTIIIWHQYKIIKQKDLEIRLLKVIVEKR